MYIFIRPLQALVMGMLPFAPNTMPFSSRGSIFFKRALFFANQFQVSNILTLSKNHISPLTLNWKDVLMFESESLTDDLRDHLGFT